MNTWLNPTVEAYLSSFGKTKLPIVWEVGSRDGHDGYELAKRISSTGDMELHLVEPNPAQARVCEENYPNAHVYEVAASNAVGSAKFIVYEGDEGAVGSSSLDLNWKEGDLEGEIIHVKTDCLENMIGDEEIDIMKIDVEGHSMQVIEGLGDKLRQIKVLHIETEKWTDSNFKVKAFMHPRGFTLVDETEQYGGMPDQVWVRG